MKLNDILYFIKIKEDLSDIDLDCFYYPNPSGYQVHARSPYKIAMHLIKGNPVIIELKPEIKGEL